MAKYTLLEVSGESCANCFSLMPVLKAIVDKRGDIRLVHVEADEETTALMEEWDVTRVPTVLLMEDGKIFARCSGFQPEEILEIWTRKSKSIEPQNNAGGGGTYKKGGKRTY